MSQTSSNRPNAPSNPDSSLSHVVPSTSSSSLSSSSMSSSSIVISSQLEHQCHQSDTIHASHGPTTSSSTSSAPYIVAETATVTSSVEVLSSAGDPAPKLTIITPSLPSLPPPHLSSCSSTPSPTLVPPAADDLKTPPYSAFSAKQKSLIVMIAAMSSFISPFSANIYFPVLNTLRLVGDEPRGSKSSEILTHFFLMLLIEKQDFKTTAEMISLTVTVYMIFQGLSPSFWGSLSDSWGRRPVYLMTLFIYVLSCIGLALAPNYTTLLILRMLQAFGSSSVIAIGAGTIGDIAVPSERGGYMGVYGLGSMLGPILGPVMGGTISSTLGWRWIFGILAIFSGFLLLLLFFFLPETLRSLVGNGSIYANPTPGQYLAERRRKAQRHHHHHKHLGDEEKQVHGRSPALRRSSIDSALTALDHHHDAPFRTQAPPTDRDTSSTCTVDYTHNEDIQDHHASSLNAEKKKSRFLVLPNPFVSLAYFREKDVALVVTYNALQYAAFYCILTSVTGLFTKIYGLNEFQIGLCYLANGFGSGMGSVTSGRIMNWQFKRLAKKMGLEDHEIKRGEMVPEFPLEHARMNFTWLYGTLFCIAMIGYGWGLQFGAPLPLTLFLQSIMGFSLTATHNATNTLMVDLFPNNSAAIVASNNILRCILGAVAVLIINPGIVALGTGWMFTTVSLILFASRLLIIAELRYGAKWRLQRQERIEKAKRQSKS